MRTGFVPYEVQSSIIKLVQSTPQLRAFSLDSPGRQWCSTEIIDAIIHITQSKDRAALTCLSLSVWPESLRIPNAIGRRELRNLNLKSLRLEQLPLMNINAGWPWMRVIIGLLRGSPQLQYLRLSVDISGINNSDIRSLFRKFCMKYAQYEGEPLRLRVLNLGEGLLLSPDPVMSQPGAPSYLLLLTQPEFLEELHLYNACQARQDSMPLVWGTISPRVTPRLQCLYIDYLDICGYAYLTSTRLVRDFVRSLEIHVENVGWFDRRAYDPLPFGKDLAAELDPADLFSSMISPITTVGLGLGYMNIGSSVVPIFPRPWSCLRSLTVNLCDWQVERFVAMCALYTSSLEQLFARVRVETPRITTFGLQNRLQSYSQSIAAYCSRLRFIKFQCSSATWPADFCCVWVNERPRSSESGSQGQIDENVALSRLNPCIVADKEPEAFWPESRKMLYLAESDLF
ncbi:hypothetical protein VM1G_02466 [Cytospora mali]|uniref:Uncharacterized protein n=1 Tax=Cytospora mali TaxID=578113 RepID=A0A194VQ62_CYTMA|nr:hypothetical protein VM1G_02466 [Valsa mali]